MYSVEHRLIIEAAQKIDHIAVLHEIQLEFGGQVRVRRQSLKNGEKWSDIGEWHIVARPLQRTFLTAMLPYLRVKRDRAELALQFLDAVALQPRRSSRSENAARWSGSRRLTSEQLDVREEFRLKMRALNRLGPAQQVAS